MSEERELVVLMTRGTDHELSSVGFTIANNRLVPPAKPAERAPARGSTLP